MTPEQGLKLINQKYKRLQKELTDIKKAQFEILSQLAKDADKKKLTKLKASIK